MSRSFFGIILEGHFGTSFWWPHAHIFNVANSEVLITAQNYTISIVALIAGKPNWSPGWPGALLGPKTTVFGASEKPRFWTRLGGRICRDIDCVFFVHHIEQ
jgi:hypothetical protein